MPRPPRNWKQANAKVEEAPWCRKCGTTERRIERAHIIGRSHDYESPVDLDMYEWEPGYVHPDRIIQLCGPPTDVRTCHGKHHAKRLDLLPLLTIEEQVQAVADAGGISQAYTLLVPSESPKRVRAPERQPMPGD